MRELTFIVTGDTGVGKSSLINRIVKQNIMAVSDSPDPVTKDPCIKTVTRGDINFNCIDTEGLNDGANINRLQTEKLNNLLRNHEKGVNAVIIVINGQDDRFSQKHMDLLKYIYDSFGTQELLKNMCIFFTKWFSDAMTEEDKNMKKNLYKKKVEEFLRKISNSSMYFQIPVYFVDSCDEIGNDTEYNIQEFIRWALGNKALSTKECIKAHYREDIVMERRTRISRGTKKSGNRTYEQFVDQERKKIIPNNGDPVRFSDWQTTRSYEEPISEDIVETRRRISQGYTYRGDSRYHMYVDQQRTNIKDLRTGNITYGQWYNAREYEEFSGSKSSRTLKRQRVDEEKVVENQSAHSWRGFSSHDHTHYKIYHITYTEQCQENTDYDGHTTTTPWVKVGSESRQLISSDRERGWTQGYRRNIR